MPSWSRRDFLRGLGAAALAGSSLMPGGAQQGPRRPNIVFILADDLGWSDTSLYGSTFYETPSIERLARRGMRFTQAYAANPLCSPTRASILTGLYPARIGITAPVCHVPEEKLEASVPMKAGPEYRAVPCDSATRLKQGYFTVAEALRAVGYRTGHFGKWHLGQEPFDALHQGFDVDVPHYPGPGPAGSYVGPWKFPPALNFPGQPGEHIEDRMAQEAARFIRENQDRPFFLNYWCFSVHSPWDARKELIAKYSAKADPDSPQRHPVYGAMVESLDDAVGTLLDTLDECGLTENTIIVFFSDNGGYIWEARNTDHPGLPVTSNAPLRGGKATLYEGGTREPCIVVWPGVTEPGSQSNALIQSIDFHPTILDMLGLAPRRGRRFDGISIVPALRGESLSRDTLFCFFPHNIPTTGALAGVWVRKGHWKLIRFFHDGDNGAHRYELYDLNEDLGETTDLAARHPGRVRALDGLIEGFLKDTGAVLPRPNPAYDPSAKLLGGWWAVRNCTLSVAEGNMVIEATGGLVTIACRDVPQTESPVTLEVRMRSTASGPAQAFWGLPGEASFRPDRAVPFAAEHDGQWHEYSVMLPVQGGPLGWLRLDPANAQGRIEIEWIRVRDATGQVLREWSFEAEEQ